MKILILDDNELLGRAIGRQLRGHDVTVLTDPELAVGCIEAGNRFDLILCDVLMPRMDGLAFHRAVLVVGPDQAGRIVFMCGDATAMTDHMRSVPNRMIEKPVDVATLQELVATVAKPT